MLEKDRMTGVRNMEIYWPDPLSPLIRTLESLVTFSVFLSSQAALVNHLHKTHGKAIVRSLGNERREKKDGELPGMGT